jgi:hypothetical protein
MPVTHVTARRSDRRFAARLQYLRNARRRLQACAREYHDRALLGIDRPGRQELSKRLSA